MEKLSYFFTFLLIATLSCQGQTDSSNVIFGYYFTAFTKPSENKTPQYKFNIHYLTTSPNLPFDSIVKNRFNSDSGIFVISVLDKKYDYSAVKRLLGLNDTISKIPEYQINISANKYYKRTGNNNQRLYKIIYYEGKIIQRVIKNTQQNKELLSILTGQYLDDYDLPNFNVVYIYQIDSIKKIEDPHFSKDFELLD